MSGPPVIRCGELICRDIENLQIVNGLPFVWPPVISTITIPTNYIPMGNTVAQPPLQNSGLKVDTSFPGSISIDLNPSNPGTLLVGGNSVFNVAVLRNFVGGIENMFTVNSNGVSVIVNGSNGNANEILTADGLGNCSWKPNPQSNVCYTSINSVPAGVAWDLLSDVPVPYNDPALSYGGFTNILGTDISYNNVTHEFTLVTGKYKWEVVQSVNVANAFVIKLSNGRLKIVDSLGNQQANDSGRYETSAGMFAAGILAYDISLNIVMDVVLPTENYRVFIKDENFPNGGLLIGKGSCIITKLQ